MTDRRLTQFIALLVFAAAASVYLITLTPTVPFWDSGEFIAVSYILGIPHPPGTPFYVLLGRVATLIPWATIAQRVNAVSAISSALAVMFTYLCGYKLIKVAQGSERKPFDEFIAHAGAVIGALMLAYSDGFWENSIEAEVYSIMSFAQILVFWLGLRWWEEHQKKPTAMPLLMATYVMWLSMGLHLGVAIMSIPLIVLVYFVDRKVALVFLMPFMTSLLVTMGLERMAGGVLLLSSATFIAYAWQKKIGGWMVAAGIAASIVGLVPAYSDAEFTKLTATIAALGVLVPLVALARKHREGRIIALALALMVIGYSTHAYLPIRAAQHPGINEGDPSNWQSFKDLLERKQYGTTNMFERRGTLETQLNKEFWRYVVRQWPILPPDRPFAAALPLLLGVAGAVWQARRERVSFMTMFVFTGVTTVGMIVYLNFSNSEVRDRDYFFQSGFHAYALWIGMGVSWLVSWVRDSFEKSDARRWATLGTAALLGLQPIVLMMNLWHTHDRRGNYVAHDYAYDMLEPLADSSYVFTNGDNDTFPLWYMQQVEKCRPDVRVVNLSLLNTDWYIRQLRDEWPKVPIALDDATIRMLGRGAVQDESGRIIYTNQFMVSHLLEQSRKGDKAWVKQPYFAVTVPETDHMGMDPYFSLEGLVYRVNRDSLQGKIDMAATRKALYETFKYRGLFLDDGTWNTKVYKDDNASTLSRNFAAAHLQLAYEYRRNGQMDLAIKEMERVSRMFPDLPEVQIPLGAFYLARGDTARALQLYEDLAHKNPGDAEARYYYGVALLYKNRVPEGLKELDATIALDPSFAMAYLAAYSTLKEMGQAERGLSYLERWVALHPGDTQAQQMVNEERAALGMPVRAPSPAPQPPPNVP